jgi:outer membrane biosynthesis protein TonB
MDEDTEEMERNFFADDAFDAPTEDTDMWTQEDELELEQFASGRKRYSGILWVAGAALLLGLILVPVGMIGLRYTGTPETVTPADTVEPLNNAKETPATDPPKEEAEPQAEPKSEPEPTTALSNSEGVKEPQTAGMVTPKPEPSPEPIPKVAPKPKAKPVAKSKPKASSRKALIDAGWGQVETNPSRAAKSFRQALDLNQGDYEANYGYGYAMLKQGDPDEAKHYLCMASGSSSRETQREVLAVLSRNGMTCN